MRAIQGRNLSVALQCVIEHLVFFVLVSPFVLAFWSPCLGKRELVFVRRVHLFVCFVRVCFCPFSLPLGVEGWLRFVIVAYPGPFY